MLVWAQGGREGESHELGNGVGGQGLGVCDRGDEGCVEGCWGGVGFEEGG